MKNLSTVVELEKHRPSGWIKKTCGLKERVISQRVTSPYIKDRTSNMTQNSDKVKNFRCDICEKSFTLKRGLEWHYKWTHEQTEPLKCDREGCGKKYRYPSHLKRHIHTQHSKIARPVCPICSMSFGADDYLKMHMKYVHGNKALKCGHEGCQKAFKHPITLHVHIRLKHSDKPMVFTCSICEKLYHSKKSLKKHIKYLHDKSQELICPQEGCEQAFSERYRLHNHFQWKHSTNPCQECGKLYTSQSGLKYHMKKVHGMQHGIEIP